MPEQQSRRTRQGQSLIHIAVDTFAVDSFTCKRALVTAKRSERSVTKTESDGGTL